MNITLSPVELLHVYKTLLSNPLQNAEEQQVLIDKIQKPISDCLEREHEKANEQMFKAWENKEQKRIEDLKASLNEFRNSPEKSLKRTKHNIR